METVEHVVEIDGVLPSTGHSDLADAFADVLRSFSGGDVYKDLPSSDTAIGHWSPLWPFLGVLHFRQMGFRLVLMVELIDTSHDALSSNDAVI